MVALALPVRASSQIYPDTAASVVTPDSDVPPAAAGGFPALPLGAGKVLLLSPDNIDRERLGELRGAETARPVMLRSVSAWLTRSDTAGRKSGVMAPEFQFVTNSALPFSMNDGDLWAGRGLNVRVAGGFFAKLGRVQLVLAPELTHGANDFFALHIPEIERVAIPPDRSQWAFPWYVNGPYSVDMPTRFGADPIGRLSLGQSSILVGFSKFQFGFANENEWWGPGIGNALVLSNNAPGFPHWLLRTTKPLETKIGSVDARWIVGGLTESPFFDTTSTNDLRSITAGAVTLRLNRPRGLTIGAARSVWQTATGWGQVPFRWLELFHSTGLPNARPLNDSSLYPGGRDQLYSLFARWVMPASGLEVYGEWGRTEFPTSLRSFLTAPNHTQGYTLGFQWVRSGFSPNAQWRIQAENTSVEQSATFRDRPLGVWYTSRKVIQGYTNRGQPLGAGIGPGSSGQYLLFDYMSPNWSAGMKFGRIRLNEDVRSISPILEFKSWCTHDINLSWGPRLTHRSRFGLATLDYAFGNRIQPWYQVRSGCPRGDAMIDIRNNTLNITWVPFLLR